VQRYSAVRQLHTVCWLSVVTVFHLVVMLPLLRMRRVSIDLESSDIAQKIEQVLLQSYTAYARASV
jgi:hypothetical protein